MLVLLDNLLTPVCTVLKQNFLDHTSKSSLHSEYKEIFGSSIYLTCSVFNFVLCFFVINVSPNLDFDDADFLVTFYFFGVILNCHWSHLLLFNPFTRWKFDMDSYMFSWSQNESTSITNSMDIGLIMKNTSS